MGGVIILLGISTLFSFKENGEGDVLIIGLAFTTIGAMIIVGQIKILLDNKPKIILNEEGISLVGSELFIYWKDIDCFFLAENNKHTREDGRSSTVFIKVYNPEEYIDKINNRVIKALFKMGMEYDGAPLGFSSDGLETNRKELFLLFNEYLEAYRAKRLKPRVAK